MSLSLSRGAATRALCTPFALSALALSATPRGVHYPSSRSMSRGPLTRERRRYTSAAASPSPALDISSSSATLSSSTPPPHLLPLSEASLSLSQLPKAIIFDMDGTLVDFLAPAKRRLVEARGREYTAEVHDSVLGLGMGAYLPVLKQVFGWSESIEELTEEMREYTNEIVDSGKDLSLPGATDILHTIGRLGIPTAVASNASHRFLSTIVHSHRWTDVLPEGVLVGGDDVQKKKPAPDAFLRAAELLGVEPEECVAVEDSVQGGTAAIGAGMRCLGVADFDETPRESFRELETRGMKFLGGKLPELDQRLRELAEN